MHTQAPALLWRWMADLIDAFAPVLLGLVSVVTLWANSLSTDAARAPRQASWYAKPNLTFSDAIAAVRHRLWWSEGFEISGPSEDVVKVPRVLLERLTDTLCYAA